MSTEKYLNRQRTAFYYMLNFKCDVFNGVTCHASRDSQLIRGLERHSLVIQSEASDNTADYPMNIFFCGIVQVVNRKDEILLENLCSFFVNVILNFFLTGMGTLT